MRTTWAFVAIVAAFALGTSAVVWTSMTSDRAVAKRAFEEAGAIDAMLTAVLARESALRGYAQTRRQSFLEPYDEANADLATAADRLRDSAGTDPERIGTVDELEGLAFRWAGSANDAIIKLKNGDEVTVESAVVRSDLITRFREEATGLRRAVEVSAEEHHREVVERAIVLVLLLTTGFVVAGVVTSLIWRRHQLERQDRERRLQERQHEFAETLQVTQSEPEAHLIVKRHVERSLPGGDVLVLNRNNSQNRLEATTRVDPASPAAGKLLDASPASCLAIRLGRTHAHSPEREPLLGCDLCSHETRSTCVPSLVGGEVIGSVLVAHPEALSEREAETVEQSVAQAAPVLANLRNLALAEIRAATDSLTGLPNARALRDGIVRMSAQASRSGAPLSAILCDLDHFKQINDVYGHEKGDQALAAAAAALRGALRESDVVGRYGGEEFLILLPDTPLEGAVVLAEKLRAEVALVDVPGVDRAITASFGIASLPQDAADGEMLVRMADRALYGAKARGRNCAVTSAELLGEPVEA